MQWQLKPATEIPKHYTMDEAGVGGVQYGTVSFMFSRTGSPNYLRNVCKHCEVHKMAGREWAASGRGE